MPAFSFRDHYCIRQSNALGHFFLKKIPEPGNFKDKLRRHDGADQFSLRSSMNLIQMMLRGGF